MRLMLTIFLCACAVQADTLFFTTVGDTRPTSLGAVSGGAAPPVSGYYTDTNKYDLWLRFSDTNTTDESGNGHNLKPYPVGSFATWTIDCTNGNPGMSNRVEYSMTLDGVNHFFYDAGKSSTLLGTNEFTVQAWVRSTNVSDLKVANMIYCTRQGGTAQGWGVDLASSGRVSFIDREDFSANFISGTNVWSSNDWNHIAVSFKSGDQRMYCNGIQVGTGTVAQSFPNSAAVGAAVGGEWNSSSWGYLFQGRLDEIKYCQYIVASNWIYSNAVWSCPTNSIQTYLVGKP